MSGPAGIDSSPQPASLTAALTATLHRRGPSPAVEFDGIWRSFADLEHGSRRVAAGLLELGVVPGDRVAVGFANSPQLIVAVLGVLRSGAVLVPINPAYTQDELLHVVGDCGARCALVVPEHAEILQRASLPGLEQVSSTLPEGEALHELPVVAGSAPALIVYTSGTTGRPKGAVLSQHALLTNFQTVAEAWRWSDSDRLLLVLPCFHLHGLGLGILTSLLVGSSVVLRRRFHPEDVLRDLAAHGCTMFFGVPTIYNRLVALPDEELHTHDLSPMRLWVSGSAPLNPATFERFRERFGFAPMDRYGMTECCFVLSTIYDVERSPGIVGRPLRGVEVRLVDPEKANIGVIREIEDESPGEILVRGPNLFDGYWGRPDATAAAMLHGYLRTGDIAVRRADGQFQILGRNSVDIIKTRGFKVGAGEIEEVLQRHAAVQEVAVVGLPDPDAGERIVAAVTLMPGATVSEAELVHHARRSLAPHKVPARIRFVADIPKTGPGKFKKKDLIAQLTPVGG